jgi:dihydrofolate reductase
LAARLNGLPKYVVSSSLDRVEWNNSTLLRGDVFSGIAELKRRPGNELQVHGSGTLIQTLMQHDLIDEFRLFIHPVVLGNGRRLFAGGTTPTALQLIDTKTTRRGVVVHIYRPSGTPEYGTVLLEEKDDVVKGVSSSRTPETS